MNAIDWKCVCGATSNIYTNTQSRWHFEIQNLSFAIETKKWYTIESDNLMYLTNKQTSTRKTSSNYDFDPETNKLYSESFEFFFFHQVHDV